MLGTTADIVTLIAFAVTIITAVYVFFIDQKVKYISNLFKLFQRLAEQYSDLKKMASQLGKFDRVTEEDQHQLQDIVGKIAVISNNIEKKIIKQNKIKLLGLREVIQTCRNLSKRYISDEDVDDLHSDLKLLIYSIEEEKKDSQVIA